MNCKWLLIVTGLLILLSGLVSGQDIAERDKLYMKLASQPMVGEADQPVVVELWTYVDANIALGMSAGFKWDSDNLRLDSVRPDPARFWDAVFFDLDGGIDSANAYKRFIYVGLALSPEHGLQPALSPQHLASYYFTLSQWEVGESFTIDTLTFKSGSEFLIMPVGGYPYPPEWPGPLTATAEYIEPGDKYVAIDGSDETGDGSQESPFATIGRAVSVANNGDQVIVGPGTYTGPGNREVNLSGKTIVVRSSDGPELTIIDMEGLGRAFNNVWAQDSGLVIEGFTFVNGHSIAGGAIRSLGASLRINDCVFAHNYSNYGGAVYLNGNDWKKTAADALNPPPMPRVTGCTFFDNEARTGSAIYYQYNAIDITVENSIFYGNASQSTAPPVTNGYYTSGTATLFCCDVFGNAGGDWIGEIEDQAAVNGNFSAHPLMCSPFADNFHLAANSPCLPAHNECGQLIGVYGQGCGEFAFRNWYVSPDGNDIDGEGTLDNPFATIQHAIDVSHNDDSILVMPGIYWESLNYNGKLVVVKSTDGPLATTITNDRTDNLVTFNHGENSFAVLDGFKLREGWIGVLCIGSGPTISHNLFVDQHIDNWSAIALCGATDYAVEPDGDIRYFASAGPAPAVIINNTIIGCANGGISTFSTIPPVIKNNIIAHNGHYGIHKEGIQPGVAPPDLSFNDVFGNPENYQEITYAGEGTISADPLFNPDLTLSESSPCIDAGDPSPMYNDADGSRADMGAIGSNAGGGGDDIVIPTNEWINVYCANPIMNGGPLAPGTVIRAYDTFNTLCGIGTVRPDGSYGYIAIYADDPYTDVDEGADPGEMVHFTINGDYVASNPSVFWTENQATFEVCEFHNYNLTRIPLHAGWNLISWNVTYRGSVAETIADIAGCVDVVLSFDHGGLTYDPALASFSTLSEMDFYHGYWLRMNCDTVLEVSGNMAESGPIPVHEGWNLVAAWVPMRVSITDAFQPIMENLTLAAGFDHGGLTWIPGMDQFNTLRAVETGFGYWLNMSAEDTLWYPNFEPVFLPVPFQPGQIILENAPTVSPYPEGNVRGSRYWMSVYGSGIQFDGLPLRVGDKLEFFTDDGALCGQGIYGEGILKFTPVYGRDELDHAAASYVAEGGSVQVFVNGQRAYPNAPWEGNGSRVRLERLFSNPADIVPESYALQQNFPNPFNPSTVIKFELPVAGHATLTVYNVLGQEVRTLADDFYVTGSHEVEWDGRDNSGRQVSSGVYLYRLQAGDFNQTRKMVLLK